MIILVTGDRNGYDKNVMEVAIKRLNPKHIIFGDSTGVDTNAKFICEELRISYSIYYAHWNKYGLKAGPIRNREMLNRKPNLVLAFHKDIKHSKGTKDCIEQAKEMGIGVELYE